MDPVDIKSDIAEDIAIKVLNALVPDCELRLFCSLRELEIIPILGCTFLYLSTVVDDHQSRRV